MSRAAPMDELLSIDVDAEVRKLCGAQLESRAQVVIEVVRLLLARGATEVRLRQTGGGLELWGEGARLPLGVLAELACLVGRGASSAERHAAVTSLDAGYGPALLALTRHRARLWRRDHDGATGVTLTSQARSFAPPGNTVGVGVWIGLRLRRADWRAVRRACRFSARSISLGRQRLDGDGRDEALVWREVAETIGTMRLGLPRRDHLHKVVHLRHSIVAEEVSRQPSALGPILVVVDDEAAASHGVWDKHAVGWVDELYEHLRQQWTRLRPADAAIGRELLFERALRAKERRWLCGVPLFATTDGQWLDLEAVQALAADGLLWAVTRRQGRRRRRGGRPVLEVDDRERAVLARLLGVSLVPPLEGGVPMFGEVGWLAELGRGLRRVWERAFAMGLGRRRVEATQLNPAEQGLATALSRCLEGGSLVLPALGAELSRRCKVVFVRGGALPATVRRGVRGWEWELPRRHPLVQTACEAALRDPRFIVPAAVALLDGQEPWTAPSHEIIAPPHS